MLNSKQLKNIQKYALDIKINTIRELKGRGFGHLGGSMSIIDCLSVLYETELKYDPKNPNLENRDRVVCSKGHAGPALYAALSLKGFFPDSWLDTLNIGNTNLPSHCDRIKTPGIDVTTGSLGQGLSLAAGLALGLKRNSNQVNTIYCIVGDGECQEGQIWEAVMFAAQYRLDNLVLIIDNNREQLDGLVSEVNSMESFEDKFKAFHWNTITIDGHDYNAIFDAFEAAKAIFEVPTVIIMNTVKGKDCSFAEGKYNHHVNISAEDADEAINILRIKKEELK